MSVLGIGVDTVHLPGFRDQLEDPASAFVEGTFTRGEIAASRARPSRDPARHLAARFAAKEAFIKAWSSANWGGAPQVVPGTVDLRHIEVLSDPWGRPAFRLHGPVAAAVREIRVIPPRPHLSLSHDGPVVTAMVVLSEGPPEQPGAGVEA